MAVGMRFDDEVRVNILNALRKPYSIQPNISKIQKLTGLHQLTIKNSLKFLKQEGVVLGFIPNVSPKATGIRLVTIMLLDIDLTDKETFNHFMKHALTDPFVFSVNRIIGSSNWNLMIEFISTSVEEIDDNLNKWFFERIPNIASFVRNKQILYCVPAVHKSGSVYDAAINLLLEKNKKNKNNEEKGMQADDAVRVKILDTLRKPGALSINASQIQKYTKYHMSTIKASLKFLKEKSILTRVLPNISSQKLGFKLMPINIYVVDTSNKKFMQALNNAFKEDKNVFSVTELVGELDWNLVSFQLYEGVKEFHHDQNYKYLEKIKNYYSGVRNRMTLYASGPIVELEEKGKTVKYDSGSRSVALVNVLAFKQGLK